MLIKSFSSDRPYRSNIYIIELIKLIIKCEHKPRIFSRKKCHKYDWTDSADSMNKRDKPLIGINN